MSDREQLLQALRIVGGRACAYAGNWPHSTCDCKYGVGTDTQPGTEQTGCPELRDLHTALVHLTDEEWGDTQAVVWERLTAEVNAATPSQEGDQS